MRACRCLQVLTWVPQNDILADPNLKAFLSHVGINSMYEVLTQKHLLVSLKRNRMKMILLLC